MFRSSAAVFYNNVVSAYDDYLARRDSRVAGRDHHLRTAIEVSAALFHFREHLPLEHKMSRAEVEQQCPDYELLADVTNASKHRQLNSARRPNPLIRSAEGICERVIVTQYEDESGSYWDLRTAVLVKCIDGTTRNLDQAIARVLNFWGESVRKWGLAPYTPRSIPEAPGASFRSRCDANLVSFEVLPGLDFQTSWMLQAFDTQKGVSLPIDLDGRQLQARLMPLPVLDFTITRKDETVQVPFALSFGEIEGLHRMPTEAAAQAYLRTVVDGRKGELQELVEKAFSALDDASAKNSGR